MLKNMSEKSKLLHPQPLGWGRVTIYGRYESPQTTPCVLHVLLSPFTHRINKATWPFLKHIIHLALGLRLGKVCEQKHEQKREKKRNRVAFLPNAWCNIKNNSCIFLASGNFLAFSSVFLAFLIPTCRYPKRE